MKKVIFSWLLSAMFISTAMAQFGANRTGFEGDHFNLEGALELFKDSRSVQDFERKLNTKTNWVNNLDLDNNGRTDYIRVNQRRQGNLNAIILQVPVTRRNVQDIAVIQIEQTGRRRAILQMVGDADLYGQSVVIEPYSSFGGTVNVYRWRAVQNTLDGFGSIYASPYAFNNYPVWYSPWDQYAWSAYQPRFSTFGRYRVSPFNRLSNVYGIYSPYRAYCPVVSNRTAQVRSQQPVRATTIATRTSTSRTRSTAPTATRATARTTTQPRATTRRATSTRTRATTQPRTTRATTTRTSTSTVRRTAPARATTTPRVSRPSTPRVTSQPRRTATPSRTTATRSTSSRSIKKK